MADERTRERDLILAPNEYAYILDETKGNVINYVGPHKTSLANTDQPVIFNTQIKRFERCNLEKAIQTITIAPEGWYVVLKNPSIDGKYPKSGTPNVLVDLITGRKVNIPGPVSFPLWPGQMARIVQGHRLRSNQYLIVRVYDEESAKTNWNKAVIKSRSSSGEVEINSIHDTSETLEITMGKLFVIKGTDVSFYIPPTGVEIVSNESSEYIREAVTLEKLEYCILLDEDGNKRYVKGPNVVFPKPTENFVTKNDSYKFKAIELNEISGLYIKVIADYTENGQNFKVGEELFITGKEQMIYFPRTEHAIIRYNENEIHYAIAIPEGEGRYVLNRLTGEIFLKRGPCMYLPDPRKEVIVRRILDTKTVSLWFPGNTEAIEANLKLSQTLASTTMASEFTNVAYAAAPTRGILTKRKSSSEFVGDDFTREQSYTKPRTVTLDTKYDGAVVINVWTGYAIQVIGKDNSRKIIIGPSTYLLEYDESLEKLEFSTGKPKNTDKLDKTVYLRVLNNCVSDIIETETSDLCKVNLKLSYRVNFEGDLNNWFNVENYVKLLCDNIRSILRNIMKQYKIETFYINPINIIRDAILGISNESKERPGRIFKENGMRIYDVEVLNVEIGNQTISDLLIQAQHNTVQQTLLLVKEEKDLDIKKRREIIKRDEHQAETETTQLLYSLELAEYQKKIELDTHIVDGKHLIRQKELDNRLIEQDIENNVFQKKNDQEQLKHEFDEKIAQDNLNRRLVELQSETKAIVDKVNAVSPDLISALQSFGDKETLVKLSETMSPLAILGGNSIVDIVTKLLKGTKLENILSNNLK